MLSCLLTRPGASLPLADRRNLDAACDQFEAAWRRGERPELDEFLTEADGPARGRLFRELLDLELRYRAGLGELPLPDEYIGRFPDFRAEIDDAFPADGDRPTAVRQPIEDATIVSRQPRSEGGEAGLFESLRAAGYEVVGELGRGGMGIVFEARQQSPGRTVALKVLRSGDLACEAERLRFRNEAEAVARLDHPRIVPIFEVGLAGDLDFFSMKLIDGAGLDRRLRDYADDPRAAARLVADAAEAIHHAHTRGILHRDLKPANILVDAGGAAHVTDFGLARRLESDDDLTRTGHILGTQAYMAPEQAEGSRAAITTATDVYGLGAVLYALLTGRAPHAGRGFVETLDKVRHEAPEPPSRSNRRVPRDLEVIGLKCLEKDPRRRYESAAALADDLRRFLDGRPIHARKVCPFVRFAFWVRRHPLPATLAAGLAAALVAGVAGITFEWREAEREAANSTALVKFLGDRLLGAASTEVDSRGANLTVRELLDRAAIRIGVDLDGRPEVEAAIREVIGGAYLSLAEFGRAESHLRQAVRLDSELYGPDHPTTLHAANLLAIQQDGASHPDESERLLRRNLEISRRTLDPTAATTLEASERLGDLLRRLHRLDDAEPLLRQTLSDRRQSLRVDHPDTLRSVHQLCQLELERRHLDAAESLAAEYEHGIRCAHGPNHPDNVTALTNRGLLQRLRGRPDLAEPYYRQAADEARRILGPDHPTTLDAESQRARAAGEQIAAESRKGLASD